MNNGDHALRRAVLNWLTRRDHSISEITQKLKAKGIDYDVVRSLIAQLVSEGLINERRFIENYVYWRRNKGFGPKRIMLELQARGITSELVAEHVQITDNTWFIAARNAWIKRFKSKQPDDFKHRIKQIRFLQSRGFTREQIASVFEGDMPVAFHV